MAMGQQQYNVPAIGYEPLRSWCEAHTKRQHGVTAHHSNSNDTTTMITDSTTHALDAATSVLLNPGDSVLIEEYTVRCRRAHGHVPRITYPSLLTAHRAPTFIFSTVTSPIARWSVKATSLYPCRWTRAA